MATQSLTLRGTKGSKLTIEEMDNNLLYLDSNGGVGVTGTFSTGSLENIIIENGIIIGMSYGCLIGTTQISLLNGLSKEIKDINVHDTLLSFDPLTNDKSSVEVISVKVYKSLTININNNLLISSPSHNHYVKHYGKWLVIPTSGLTLGDILSDINGNEIEITSIIYSYDEVNVYNIEVTGSHLYYANEILTHNKP